MSLKINKSKLETFLLIAKHLNKSFGVVPILFGSLGLNKTIGEFKKSNDIDILLPDEFVNGRFKDLVDFMKVLSFRFKREIKEENEYEFAKGGEIVSFGGEDDLLVKLEMDSEKLKISQMKEASFKEFSPAQYLELYQFLAKNKNRRKENKKDSQKIRLIKKYIKSRSR